MLKWNFDVERVSVILGHNVEYTGSTSRLPILVLECSNGGHLEWGPCQKGLKRGFLRGKKWMKLAGIFSWDNPSVQANHFHMVELPGSSGAMHRHAKTPCLG